MPIIKYHIGTTQWGLKEWKGSFYTKDARPGDFLRQYASVFNSVEGNTTFYRVPSEETLQEWVKSVPTGFRFCFKFPQTITHFKQLDNATDDIMRFLSLFEPYQEKTGPFHIQLSPGFSFGQFSTLESVLTTLPTGFSYAVEVRHSDYFDMGPKERELDSLLTSLNIDRVIFDTRRLFALQSDDPSITEAQSKKPKTPIRFTRTGSRPFVRFVGANDILNNETYLKEWAIIIADWIREGVRPYIFIHSPDRKSAPAIARYFHKQLGQLIELSPMPDPPVDHQDEQLGLF